MTDINDSLYNYLLKLPKSALLNLLLSAVDEMQGYNGQSQNSAICRALGAKEIDDEKGTRWRLPSLAETKATFKNIS